MGQHPGKAPGRRLVGRACCRFTGGLPPGLPAAYWQGWPFSGSRSFQQIAASSRAMPELQK
jgi:hypothetical protein